MRGLQPRTLTGRLGLAATSGILLNGAFPPVDQRWLALVALVPLLVALREGRGGARVGLVFGLAFFVPLLFWISQFGFLALIVLGLVLSMFTAAFGWFAARIGGSMLGRLAGWPLLWAGAELVRARTPVGGFTWGSLGYSQIDGSTLLSLARIGGVTLLGAAVLLCNALFAELVRNAGARIRIVVALAALLIIPALLPLGYAGATGATMDIAAVQGNVDRARFSNYGNRGRTGPEDVSIIQAHLRLTEQLLAEPGPHPALVVWPENSFDRDPRLNPDLFDPIRDLVRRTGTPLLMSAIMDAGERFTNSNLLVDANGAIVDRYDKVHLVPFGEYVPIPFARSLVPALRTEIPVDGLPGTVLRPFAVGSARVGTLICFESTYAGLSRTLAREGAEVIVVTTNNASYGTSPAASQHLDMSRMRAVEEGRALVHAAISGHSAFAFPDGSVEQESPLFEQALLRAQLPLATGLTPYGRYGSLIEGALGVSAFLAALAGIALGARRKGAEQR